MTRLVGILCRWVFLATWREKSFYLQNKMTPFECCPSGRGEAWDKEGQELVAESGKR